MDFKTLLPDFEAIKKTDWGKPQVDTKDTMNLVMLGGAALMVIFTFLSWCTYSEGGKSVSVLGITTWYGIFAFLCAAVALAGVLYKHTTLTFCAAVLGVLFGVLGMVLYSSCTVDGVTVDAKILKATVEAGKASVSHLGAILYLVATVATAAAAYLKITKK